MLDAIARSIAETAAGVLRGRANQQGAQVSDEAIGLYLWNDRGFRDHDTLVSLINHTRSALDRPRLAPGGTVSCQPRKSAPKPRPVQLAFDWITA